MAYRERNDLVNELNVSATKQSQQGVREEPRKQAFACGVNSA